MLEISFFAHYLTPKVTLFLAFKRKKDEALEALVWQPAPTASRSRKDTVSGASLLEKSVNSPLVRA